MSSEGNNNKRTQIPIVCPGHTRPLAELQYLWNEDEQRTFLLSACHDKMPMLRDGSTGDWIGTFQGHKGAVWSCQMDPSGNLAATASGDYSARVWDAVTGQSLMELPHQHIVKTVVFSPNSKLLATGGKEAVLRIFQLVESLRDKKTTASIQVPQEAAITKAVWTSDTTILCACANGKIYLWDVSTDTANLMHTFDTKQSDEIRDLEVITTTATANANGQRIMTAAAGTHVYFFDLATHQLLKDYKMPIHFRDEGGATLHPSGKTFVAGGSDLWVRVFDFETGAELECHKGHHGPIRCVRFAPDGKLYATGSEDGTIRLWKTEIPNPAATP
jgi:serine-threonine kinase receptor-associated protein